MKASAAKAASHLKRMIVLPVVRVAAGLCRPIARRLAWSPPQCIPFLAHWRGFDAAPRRVIREDRNVRGAEMAASPNAIEKLEFPILVGDIGGTNARFALIPDPEAPLLPFLPVATADFPDIEAAIEASVLAHTELRPRSAVIDLAGPIKGDAVKITNAHWVIRPAETIARTGIRDVVL